MSNSSLWSDALRKLLKNRAAMFGVLILVSLIILAILAPVISPYPYDYQNLELGASAPSSAHLLGTDTLGRDLLSRLLYGSRVSLMVGFVATAVALVIGVTWGIVSGYYGGKVDAVMMRIVDILYGLPFIIFIILLMVVFGRNIWLLFGAIGAVEWLTMARIVRGQTISLKEKEFIETSKALGQSNSLIIIKHIIPNLAGPIIVYITLMVPSVIILESFLSFLGLGVQEPLTSWGVLISEGSREMETAWWLLIFPGSFMVITLASLNFIGDGLRDAIDPKEY